MRKVLIAVTAGLLLLPAVAPAKACGTAAKAEASAADLSAAKKKPVKKRVAKKGPKKPKEKVEYMRAAPMK